MFKLDEEITNNKITAIALAKELGVSRQVLFDIRKKDLNITVGTVASIVKYHRNHKNFTDKELLKMIIEEGEKFER